ncbi:hypothetical protein DPC56_05930 [Methanothermobacter tenebrarum]|uniref:Uncharacterized protein n=2 Tax=Methanothermobacter tenebrarum TaxID=680118 RepID=A0A328PGN2_9EURY|nr:hypothetical protein DPC56_05930 [Methanothermobacter tenebrarum]
MMVWLVNYIEVLKINQFSKLRKIEQLGVITQVEPSASHTRWDYVLLQLHLINKIRENIGNLGNVEVEGEKLSGAEILQLWVFLFNIGHLPGTFATMRGLLSALVNEEELRERLREKVPEKIKKYFDEVIEKRNIFELPKLLSSILLNERLNEQLSKVIPGLIYWYWKPEKSEKELKSASPNSNEVKLAKKIKKLKSYFRMVRRLAYIFLDSKYVKSPISFDVSKILLNFDNYKDLIMEPGSQLDKTLQACEDFLSVALYHSKDTITQLGIHSKKVVSKEVERTFKDYEKDLFKLLKDETMFYPKRYNPLLTFHVLLDLNHAGQDIDEMIGEMNKDFYELEDELNKNWQKEAMMIYQPGSNKKHIAVNLSIFQEQNIWQIIKEFTSRIIDISSNKRIKEVLDEQLFPCLFKFAINTLFESKSLKTFYFAIDRISAGKRESLKKKVKEWLNKENDESKKYELESLKKIIKEKVDKGIIGHSIKIKEEVRVENQDGQDICEFDALSLLTDKNGMRVLFLEAKRGKKSPQSEAKDQLKRSLQKLNLLKDDKIQTGKNKKYAYYEVKL